MAGHNGYFGLSAAHVIPIIDEENLVYGDPVDVGELGGIIEISMASQTSTDPVYATDRVWIDSTTDNGFTGTVRIINVWGHPVLRRVFGALCGYEFATDGTLLGSSDKAPQKFALMGEASGNLENKRTCYLLCQFGKPAKNAQSKEESGTNQPDEFSITSRPVKLASGWKGSFYENVPADGALYDDFFEAVRTDMVPTADGEAALAALTVGTLALTPSFNGGTLTYACTTSSASVAITAVPTEADATVEIKNGSTTVTNGGTASLSNGENVITITVTNGESVKTYTVTVTRGA